jgi:hypothetical protein
MDARKLKTITARRYWPVAPAIQNTYDDSTCFISTSMHNIKNNMASHFEPYSFIHFIVPLINPFAWI